MMPEDEPVQNNTSATDDTPEPANDREEGRACTDGDDVERTVRHRDFPDPVEDFKALYKQLRPIERKYIRHYADIGRKDKAAEAVGLSPSTVYHWEDEIHEAANHLNDKAIEAIEAGRDAQSQLAVEVFRTILEDDDIDDRVRFEAAKYIQDQQTGKPTRKQEVEHSGGIELDPDDEDAIDDALSHFDD